MQDPNGRKAFTEALREAADYLDAHGEVPLPGRAELVVHADGSDADQRAEVDRVAELLGTTPTGTSHYRAKRTWGPVAYEVIAISEASMAKYNALMSYGGSIVPEDGAP
ncbi:hypothetical protein [Actinomadura rupiterrae]|uniref:hypothetical protein n=1 Tax=Actinomadura rupiterrae TaxID=559627 RepID=UPI0020A4C3A4|nr:hypothetical protein [Actinomadura rupiterrae]MCP2339218.1 hypothetical protein [Actinomadura rupiterrae]